MSFTEIDQRMVGGPTKSGVTVSFRVGKRDNGTPRLIIGMRAAFLESSGFGEATTYRIAVGRDEDTGRIRVWPSASGAFAARKAHGARILDLGHIASFGARAHKSRPATVTIVDGAAVITLPGGADAEDIEQPDETAPPHMPAAAAPIPAAPKANPKPVIKPQARIASGPASTPVPGTVANHNGVTILLGDERGRVIFKDTGLDVSPRGARLVELLAKAMPSCIDDSFIAGKLWTAKPPGWTTSLDLIVTDLKVLKAIGLEVRTQRGIGRQLVVL